MSSINGPGQKLPRASMSLLGLIVGLTVTVMVIGLAFDGAQMKSDAVLG
jgi:hypothetical protein